MTGEKRIATPRAGASDGTTPLSWKIVTTANCSYSMPFETQPIVIYNNTLTPQTATVEGIWGGGVLPTDEEIFVELEYLGDGSSPLATLVNDGKANLLATAAAQTASSATWAGISGATTWDSATVTNATLSNGNLTATHTNTTANSGARSVEYKNSGKYYFEFSSTKIDGADGIGVVAVAGTYTNVVTNATNGAYAYAGTGNIWTGGGNTGLALTSFSTSAALMTIGVAVDLDNEKVWFRLGASGNWNGQVIGSQNPATNTGGVNISALSGTSVAPVVGFSTAANTFQTANFGASTFTGATPSGFTAGWPMGAVSPFKLSVPFTAAQPGWVFARVKCARPSSTFYIDPKVTLAAYVAPPPWTPTDLGSTVRAWYKFDALTGTNGDAIGAVTDASGNGFHLTQTGTLRPTLATAEQNGLNTLHFTQSNTQRYTLPLAILTGTSAASVYIVYKVVSDSVNNGLLDFGGSFMSSHWPFSDGNIYCDFGSTARKTVGNPSVTQTTYRIISVYSAASDWAFYIDGGSGGSSGGTSPFFSTATNTHGPPIAPFTPYLGANQQPVGLDGNIAEIIFTNAKESTTDRQKMEGYLAHKWGLTGNLDATHPYKSTPP